MESVLVTTRDFEVCGTCCELRGPFAWRVQGVTESHVQDCACARGARAGGERPETWRGFDFNTVAELCQACGCQVLPSGSRFSVWLCSVCKDLARALNGAVGRSVVPLGRHSIMSGFGLPVTPMPTNAEIDAFVARLGNLGARIDRLRDWAHRVVRANLSAIGHEDAASVTLPDYLAAAREFDRRRAFDAMVASIIRGGQPA
jgi:hypothetical protein